MSDDKNILLKILGLIKSTDKKIYMRSLSNKVHDSNQTLKTYLRKKTF